MPEGAFPLSFNNGVRGIMVGAPDARLGEHEPRRKYIAFAMEGVPSWFDGAWSFCRRPDDEERQALDFDPGPGSRFDAICEIDADGDVVPTAYLYSVPDL